jgi:hypothetical protein
LKTNPEIKSKFYIEDPEYLRKEAEDIDAGAKCVTEDGQTGIIKFVGKVLHMGHGYFVGIELDEPNGNCDGSFMNY